jgi:hypothetical protein
MPDTKANVLFLSDTQRAQANRLLRPVSPTVTGASNLSRDKQLLADLAAWFRDVLLAKRRYKVKLDPRQVFQMRNIRPDCNGYLVRVLDKTLLAKIISQGEMKTRRTAAVLKKVSDSQILCGNLYWLRFVKQNAYMNARIKTPHVIEEIYWLDIWYQVRGVAMPVVRVYYNSVGLADLPVWRSEGDLSRLIKVDPYFVEANTIMVTWHDLAQRLKLQSNIYYLRACFTAASFESDVVGLRASPGKTVSHRLRRTIVYRRNGNYTQIAKASPSPFDESLAFVQQVTQYTLFPMSAVRKADLSGVVDYPRFFGLPVQFPLGEFVAAPQPAAFPESHPAGREFAFFASSRFRGVVYRGGGYFSMTFQMSGAAAAGGVRGSGWSSAAEPEGSIEHRVEPAGREGASGSGSAGQLGALGGVFLGNAYREWSTSRPERQRRMKRIYSTAQACADTSASEAECHECIEEVSAVKGERESMAADATMEVISDIAASAALGCLAGGALGAAPALFSMGTAILVGCAVGAGVGLLYGGAEAIADMAAYSKRVNEFHSAAFSPCDTVEMKF